MEGALCKGQWWLFDSTDKRDHVQAKAICAECPAAVACRELLAKPSHIGTIPMPQGTWAGKLYGGRNRVRGAA